MRVPSFVNIEIPVQGTLNTSLSAYASVSRSEEVVHSFLSIFYLLTTSSHLETVPLTS